MFKKSNPQLQPFTQKRRTQAQRRGSNGGFQQYNKSNDYRKLWASHEIVDNVRSAGVASVGVEDERIWIFSFSKFSFFIFFNFFHNVVFFHGWQQLELAWVVSVFVNCELPEMCVLKLYLKCVSGEWVVSKNQVSELFQ